MRALIAVILTVLLRLDVVQSFPTGAGGCTGGEAAPMGAHLGDDGRPVQTGPLADGQITVTIDGVELDPSSTEEFPTGEDLEIVITASAVDFRGVLIRLEAPAGVDTSAVLSPGDATTQAADACTAPVVGITHVDNSDKSSVTGVIRFDEEAVGVFLDINVVFVNDASIGSAYVYSRFTSNFRQLDSDTSVPTLPQTTPAPAGTGTPTIPQTTPSPTSVTSPTPMPPTTSAPRPPTTGGGGGAFFPLPYEPDLPTNPGPPSPGIGKGKGKGLFPGGGVIHPKFDNGNKTVKRRWKVKAKGRGRGKGKGKRSSKKMGKSKGKRGKSTSSSKGYYYDDLYFGDDHRGGDKYYVDDYYYDDIPLPKLYGNDYYDDEYYDEGCQENCGDSIFRNNKNILDNTIVNTRAGTRNNGGGRPGRAKNDRYVYFRGPNRQ